MSVLKKFAVIGNPIDHSLSPKIHSIIISQENKPHISIMGFNEHQEPILQIPQSLDKN